MKKIIALSIIAANTVFASVVKADIDSFKDGSTLKCTADIIYFNKPNNMGVILKTTYEDLRQIFPDADEFILAGVEGSVDNFDFSGGCTDLSCTLTITDTKIGVVVQANGAYTDNSNINGTKNSLVLELITRGITGSITYFTCNKAPKN